MLIEIEGKGEFELLQILPSLLLMIIDRLKSVLSGELSSIQGK
jgi:hypothetical protein